MKLAYFREEWQAKPEWIRQAELAVEKIWKSTYRGYSAAHPVRLIGAGQEELPDGQPLSRWERKRLALSQRDDNLDMMDRFQQEAPSGDRITDVVRYWVSKLLEPQWRDLARMALDYLTIPAMSAEPERVFSGAKIT